MIEQIVASLVYYKAILSISSMMKVQRMISTSCHALEYFLNNLFVFDATTYNTAWAKLNEIDREIFYNRSKVNFCLDLSKFFILFL